MRWTRRAPRAPICSNSVACANIFARTVRRQRRRAAACPRKARGLEAADLADVPTRADGQGQGDGEVVSAKNDRDAALAAGCKRRGRHRRHLALQYDHQHIAGWKTIRWFSSRLSTTKLFASKRIWHRLETSRILSELMKSSAEDIACEPCHFGRDYEFFFIIFVSSRYVNRIGDQPSISLYAQSLQVPFRLLLPYLPGDRWIASLRRYLRAPRCSSEGSRRLKEPTDPWRWVLPPRRICLQR